MASESSSDLSGFFHDDDADTAAKSSESLVITVTDKRQRKLQKQQNRWIWNGWQPSHGISFGWRIFHRDLRRPSTFPSFESSGAPNAEPSTELSKNVDTSKISSTLPTSSLATSGIPTSIPSTLPSSEHSSSGGDCNGCGSTCVTFHHENISFSSIRSLPSILASISDYSAFDSLVSETKVVLSSQVCPTRFYRFTIRENFDQGVFYNSFGGGMYKLKHCRRRWVSKY